jgi:hypothetical protein
MIINTIDLAINGRHLEAPAKTQIYPGMLLERYEDGVRPHSIEAGIAPPLIAMENKFMGKDIHIPYEIDDTVYMRYCLPGDVFWGRLVGEEQLNGFFVSAGVQGPGYLELVTNPLTDGMLVGRELESFVWFPYGGFIKVEVL